MIEKIIRGFAKMWNFKVKPYSAIKYNPHYNVEVDFDSLSPDFYRDTFGEVEAYLSELKADKNANDSDISGTEMYLDGRSCYLPKPVIGEIQRRLRDALDCPDLIVFYSYCETPAEIYGSAKYIYRSTFLDINWNRELAINLGQEIDGEDDSIIGAFRNGRWWGIWKGAPVWELTHDIEDDAEAMLMAGKLAEGICPICGLKLKGWNKPISSKWLEAWHFKPLGNTGYYYQDAPPDAPADGLTLEQLMKLQEKELDAAEKRSVDKRHIENYDIEAIYTGLDNAVCSSKHEYRKVSALQSFIERYYLGDAR